MEKMDSITSGLKETINKLTELLQLSLSNHNGTILSDSIVELIAHTTKLSHETRTLQISIEERDNRITSCLKDQNELIQEQQRKIRSTRPNVATREMSCFTDPVRCDICETTSNIVATQKSQIVSLNTAVEILQGKLTQSKYLIQAQQVIISDLEAAHQLRYNAHPDRQETHNHSHKDETQKNYVSHSAHNIQWNSLFNHPDATINAHKKSPRLQNCALPPKRPVRYSSYTGDDEIEEGSMEGRTDDDEGESFSRTEVEQYAEGGQEKDHSDQLTSYAEDEQLGNWDDHDLSQDEEEPESGSPNNARHADDMYFARDDYLQPVSDTAEELEEDKFQEESEEYYDNEHSAFNSDEDSVDSEEQGSVEVSERPGSEGSRHNANTSLGLSTSAHSQSDTSEVTEPGAEDQPSWAAQVEGDVEDSFALIKNFYDIGY